MAHDDLEKAKRLLELTEAAIETIKAMSAEERRILHQRHAKPSYIKILDILDLELTECRARVHRYSTNQENLK